MNNRPESYGNLNGNSTNTKLKEITNSIKNPMSSQSFSLNPFVLSFAPEDVYEDEKTDVTVIKRQRDPIRACHCSSCQFSNHPQMVEDAPLLESSQMCSCSECRNCGGEENYSSKNSC